jgi:hypothetical protein
MLQACRENGFDCDLHPEGKDIWLVQVKGKKSVK